MIWRTLIRNRSRGLTSLSPETARNLGGARRRRMVHGTQDVNS